MNRTAIILAVALALTTPAATAWYSHGEQEPDTIYDVQAGRMFTDTPTTDGVDRVYFNAFQNWYTTGVNPNSGTLGSRFLAPALLHFQAIVGVWRDCNNDGYVGLAESAVISYRAELLQDTSICPDVDGRFQHNDGEWVHEFIHVAPHNDPDNNTAVPNLVANDDTRIWGDLGRPGFAPGQSCPLLPPPHGASSSTGAAVRYADCILNYKITDGSQALAPLDGTGGYRFSFENDEAGRKNQHKSASVLNQDLPESVFGNPHYDGSEDSKETGALQKDPYAERPNEYTFKVFDCNGARAVDVHDDGVTAAGTGTGDSDGERNANAYQSQYVEVGTSQAIVRDPTVDGEGKGQLEPAFGTDNTYYANWTDDTGSYFWVGAVAPEVNDPRWSIAASLNQTADANSVTGDCDPSNGNSYNGAHSLAFFYADGRSGSATDEHEGTAQAPGKNKANMIFGFYDGVGTAKQVRDVFGERTPREGGLVVGNWWYRAGYDANVIWVTDPQVFNPDTLQPSTAAYWTFYASLRAQDGSADNASAWGLALPIAEQAVYGAYNCVDGIGDGIGKTNGWLCDPSLWYVDASGIDQDPDRQNPRPGWGYDLLDVDCQDGELVRGSGVRASLIGLEASNPPCESA